MVDRAALLGAANRWALHLGAALLVGGVGTLAAGSASFAAGDLGSTRPASSPARSAAPCTPILPAGSSVLTIRTGGREREAIVHLPADRGGGRLPVAIGFHGYTATAGQLEATSGLSALADADGFAVAYVQGAGLPADWTFPGHIGAGADDMGLIPLLIDRLIRDACADPRRVVLFGHSMGGGMASAAACAFADRVAGAVFVSAFWTTLPCELARPVPIVAMHALDDPVLPYDGGLVGGGGPTVLPVESAVRAWAARDGCTGEPDTRTVDPQAVERTWLGCAAPVRLVRSAVGGHEWPPMASERIVRMLLGEPSPAPQASGR